MKIEAGLMHFKKLNELIRESEDIDIEIDKCIGQRYIADGLSGKHITVNGTPGNALGAYMNGATVVLNGNAQEATGDTMNEGAIYISGNAGDATGYAMRGGRIFVRGNAGYRAGIHMKAYREKHPVLVIGGEAGSFLGEYQAGGTILVLGLGSDKAVPVSNFCGNGMHGGKIIIRASEAPAGLSDKILVTKPTKEDMAEISALVGEYCDHFGGSKDEILSGDFIVLRADTKNPYKQLYTHIM